MQAALVLAAATAGGLLFQWLRVPGGLVVGAMLGAGLVSMSTGQGAQLPGPVQTAALILIGATVGVQVDRELLASAGAVFVPALLSAIGLIVVGLALAMLLQAMNVAPGGSLLLATSPGALSAMLALAADLGQPPVQIAVFHVTRVIIVMLTMPLIITAFARWT